MSLLQTKLYRNRGNACMTHSQTEGYSIHGILSFPFYCRPLFVSKGFIS
jgi:hypothetical protein